MGDLGPCPLCGTSDRYSLRHFKEQIPSYVLCKWCGYRRNLNAGEEDFTLAVPVIHVCPDGQGVLTWVEYGLMDSYRGLTWTCEHCDTTFRVWNILRPYPRFAGPSDPIESAGS